MDNLKLYSNDQPFKIKGEFYEGLACVVSVRYDKV